MFDDADDQSTTKNKDCWLIDQENGYVQHKPSGIRLRQFDPVQVELSIKPSILQSNFKKQINVKLIDPKID